MRDLLTGLAIILVVVLTTMLIAPYFVDWNGQRGVLEAQLARALGQKVTIGGDIDLKLLPTPYLRLNQTVIGSDEGPVRIGIRHLDFELAVAPLLHGEIDIVEGRLEEPIIRLALQQDRTLPTLPSLPALQLDVRLERITVVDGTLAVADPQSGRTFTADHLDFAVEAPSLAGPYKGGGTQGAADKRTKFRFSTAAVRRTGAAARTRVRFAFDETPRHPGLDLDGDLAFEPAGADKVGERFEGSVVATGHLRPEGRDPVGWRLAGPLRASPQNLDFGNGELRIGSGDGDLVFAATAQGSIAGAPNLRANLTAKQLDLDRLSGVPVALGEAPPPPPRLPGLAALRALLASVAPPLPTSLDVDVASAIWGGEPLRDLAAHLSFGGAPPRSSHLAGEGPGGLHLDLDGKSLDGAEGGGFDGRFALAASDLPTALRWLRSVAPADAAIGRGDPPFRTASLASRVSVSANGVELRELTLGLDRSTLSGSARIAAGEPGHDAPGKITADLSTPALDIDALPDLQALHGASLPFDLALKLDAGALKVARAGSGSLGAGHLRLDVARTGQHLVVDDFEVDDLGGATVRAKGDLDGPATTLDLDLDAAHLDGTTALLRQVAPGRAVDALATRAGSLAPAKLHLAAGFTAGDHGRVVPSHLDISGHLAATTLAVHLAPDGGGNGVRLEATAEAPRGDGLLRQIGLPVAQADGDGAALGAGRVSLAATGPVDGSLDTRVEAAFGTSRLAVNGSFELFAAGRGGSGAVTLSSADAIPLLHALGLASPDARTSLPAELTGGLALGQTGIAVSDLKGRVDGIGVAGTLRWRSANGPGHGAGSGQRQPDDPALTGSLDIDRLTLGNLFALVLGPGRPAPSGSRWSGEPFAAGLAESPRSLVAVRAKALDLGFGLTARDATLDVATAPGSVGVTHAGGSLAGGHFAGEGTLRRDGRQATLAGTVSVSGTKLDIPALKAQITGKLDFAGGGASPLALVASLAGSGEATFTEATLADINARALPSVFAETENDTLAIDAESIGRAFEAVSLDKGQKTPAALEVGTRQLAASLTSGVLALSARGDAVRAGPVAVRAEGGYDLRRLSGTLRVTETLTALPKAWSGPPPSLAVTVTGLPGGARRSLDVGDFINAVAARAIARETARIETFEFDVRERALFNARLQFDHRREQDRLKVEADAKAAAEAARKAEAERRAKAEAARLEKERNRSDAAAPSGDSSNPLFPAPSAGNAADPTAAGRY